MGSQMSKEDQDKGAPEGSKVIRHPAVSDPEEIRRRVEERVQAERDEAPSGDAGGGDGEESGFVRRCLAANELGDGWLFKRIHKGRFLFNKAMDEWMHWTGHHWEVDVMDEVLDAVEAVVAEYLKERELVIGEIRALDDDHPRRKRLISMASDLEKRVKALRSTRRRGNCVSIAHTSGHAAGDVMAIRGDEIDKKPWLLACPNGVVELKTGALRDGRSDDFLLKAARAPWQGIDAPRPLWEQTLLDIFEEDDQLVAFLQRLFGSALVGASIENKIAVLTGQGRNGKSMIVETLCHVLGDMAGPIRSEMLLDQSRNLNSAGPTPDIMSLRGLRFAFASETDEGCRVSPSRVKWMTGNDSLTGRNPHDKYEVSFKPTHTLFLLTNHKPHAPAEDFAFWQRMLLIPFNISYVDYEPERENERRADQALAEKLKAEASGILAWLVKGCLLWQKQGLDPPIKVKRATAEYQKDEDNVAAFIDVCCFVGEHASCGATPLYEKFEQWWKKYVSNFPMKQKKFGNVMRKRFHSEKVGGVYRYYGIGLLAEDADQDD